ncbi:hypothetical protein KAW18_02305 [candidate division WOR-3 bacterium]|nr:hypothetical protein [candidate division WOR-3 bacterium]
MNIVEWKFGNVLASCGIISLLMGFMALFITGNHLFYVPIGLGLVLVFLKHMVM